MALEPRQVRIETGASALELVGDEWQGAGEGSGATVVLAHGGGQTRHSWGATAEALAGAGHHVVSIDLRGHGDSGWAPDRDYSMDRFADDAQAWLDHLDESVIWVGASLGGMTGLLSASRVPERFLGLVLVDITPRPAAAGVARILEFMGERVHEGFASLEEAADAIASYQPHRQRPKDLSGLAKNLRRGNDGRWRWHWDPAFLTGRTSVNSGARDQAQRAPVNHSQIEEAAAALKLPVLLVRGRQSDLVTEAEARAFLRLVPHADYVDVADAAHMVAGDKNDIFTDAVTGFIARQDAAAGA